MGGSCYQPELSQPISVAKSNSQGWFKELSFLRLSRADPQFFICQPGPSLQHL